MRAFLNVIKDLNIIPFFPFILNGRKTHRKIFVCLISLLIFFAPLFPDRGLSENLPPSEMTVKGSVRLASSKLIPEDGLNVVLLKLVLNTEGQVIPVGPQGRVKTDSEGNFEFLKVIPDYRAGYKLGTRVDGKLYSTKVFFFKSGEERVEKDIIIPSITKDIEKLEISQVSLVIESGLSLVTITEVLSFYNSSLYRISTKDHKLKHKLPKGVYDFTMIQSKSGPEIEHQIDNRMLIINHVFPPGNTQIIFHYNIGAWLGSLKIQREFNQSLDKVSVFTPSGQLKIESAQLIFSGTQQMHKTNFLVWKGKASDSNQLKFKISNVPVDSVEYIGISGIILFLLFLSVIVFYRSRLMTRNVV